MKWKSKDITLIAVLAAAWIAYAFISSSTIGQAAHGMDVHVARSVFLVLVAALIGRFGGATWMTGIVGLYYLSSKTPYPAVIITAATILAGLTYDVYLRLVGHERGSLSFKFVPIGIVLAGLVQSATTLGVLTYIGFFPSRALETIWKLGLARNAAASFVGAVLGVLIAKRAKVIYPR